MAKRTIDSELFRSQGFGALDCTARLLYIGMVANADDQGRILAEPTYLRSLIFPFSALGVEGVAEAVEALGRSFVLLYEGAGLQLAQFPAWWETQGLQYAQPSQYPAPEGWADRIRLTATKGVIVTHNWRRKDNSRCPDTCDAKGRPVVVADSPPTPQPASLYKTTWSEDSDRQNVASRLPQTEEEVTRVNVNLSKIDPRKFVGGLIPKGKGATPLEVFYEFTSIKRTQLGDYAKGEIERATDLDKWRKVLADWIGRGYKPDNVKGQLDWYDNGIPERPNLTGGSSQAKSNGNYAPSADPGLATGQRATLTAGQAATLFARKKS